MHAYEVPRRQSYQSIPSMRPTQDPSSTPIYDTLYAEWVRTYRTLPGDRHGEEDMGFTGFGNLSHGSGGPRATGSYTSASYAARHAAGHLATQRENQPGHTSGTAAVWQPVGRIPTGHTGMHHIPSPLPPNPRRGL
ncbi:hypothetical protein IQ64_16780 [Streptomyces stelliscabiei]|nr:hypothetical protein IQ64_16780 [Streptomyces stelliscabiei]